ncbi:TIM23 translocase, partial [Polypterus senegalus]
MRTEIQKYFRAEENFNFPSVPEVLVSHMDGRPETLPGPDPGVVPRAVRENACQKHNTLHHRLDFIEKRVEDAVGKLESEVSILLDAIEAPEWSPLLSTGGPAIDIYDNIVTGMSPLSPYLNVDPRYLVQDSEEFILPTGANKTRGRFELAFFTIGGCCMTGATFGALNGLRLGITETRDMAWSKPRNVQILNMVTRQGALWANTLGSLALLYSVFGVVIEKTRGAEDDLNTIGAGTLTGMLYKSTVNYEPLLLSLAKSKWFVPRLKMSTVTVCDQWDLNSHKVLLSVQSSSQKIPVHSIFANAW